MKEYYIEFSQIEKIGRKFYTFNNKLKKVHYLQFFLRLTLDSITLNENL